MSSENAAGRLERHDGKQGDGSERRSPQLDSTPSKTGSQRPEAGKGYMLAADPDVRNSASVTLHPVASVVRLPEIPGSVSSQTNEEKAVLVQDRTPAKVDRKAQPLVPQSAPALMAQIFPKQRWLVDGMICDGSLTVLAGKAKVGKSWACLQLAGAVASGVPFLGRTTARSSVLYCALEDSPRRIQRRLLKQGQSNLQGLDFLFTIPAITDRDGIASLWGLIITHRYEIVIVDTWAAAMGAGVDEDRSGDMAPIYNDLRHVAQVTGCAIVVVSHHGKVTNSDAVYDVRGSSSIGAAADTIIGLYKDRGQTQGTLAIVSRDVEEAELSVAFDKKTCTWAYVGEAQMLPHSGKEQEALSFLGTVDEADAECVGTEIGLTRQGAEQLLKRLQQRGLVTSRQESLPMGGRTNLYSKQPLESVAQEDNQSTLALVASVAIDTW
jgi:hypothetical protein